MGRPLLLIFSLLIVLSSGESAQARRHHKFKGVIIVNQILKLDGTIANNGNPALEYSGVKQGDLLETGENSSAIIRIPGLAIFKVGPSTRFHLTSFSDRNESRFEIEKGQVLALFRRPGHHIIQTPHAVLTLHGTTFFAKVDSIKTESSGADFFCLCDGKVQAQVRTNKRNPSSEPTASPSPYLGPQISAEPPVKASPGPSAAELVTMASPTATPVALKRDLEITSQSEHKQFLVSELGIELKDLKLLDLHGPREIQELDSLYSLP